MSQKRLFNNVSEKNSLFLQLFQNTMFRLPSMYLDVLVIVTGALLLILKKLTLMNARLSKNGFLDKDNHGFWVSKFTYQSHSGALAHMPTQIILPKELHLHESPFIKFTFIIIIYQIPICEKFQNHEKNVIFLISVTFMY